MQETAHAANTSSDSDYVMVDSADVPATDEEGDDGEAEDNDEVSDSDADGKDDLAHLNDTLLASFEKRDILKYIQQLDEKINANNDDVDSVQRLISEEQLELESTEEATRLEEQRAAELSAKGVTRQQLDAELAAAKRVEEEEKVKSQASADAVAAGEKQPVLRRKPREFVDLEQQLIDIVRLNLERNERLHQTYDRTTYPKWSRWQHTVIQWFGCIRCYEQYSAATTQCPHCGLSWELQGSNDDHGNRANLLLIKQLLAASEQPDILDADNFATLRTPQAMEQRSGLLSFNGLAASTIAAYAVGNESNQHASRVLHTLQATLNVQPQNNAGSSPNAKQRPVADASNNAQKDVPDSNTRHDTDNDAKQSEDTTSEDAVKAALLLSAPLYTEPTQTLAYHHSLAKYNQDRYHITKAVARHRYKCYLVNKNLASEYKYRLSEFYSQQPQLQPSVESNRLRLPDLRDACADIGVDMKLVLSRTPLSMISNELVRQVRIMRSQARMPDMYVTPEERRATVYVNTNGYVEDAKDVERSHRLKNPWTESEKAIFIKQYLKHPKQFRKIAQHLPTKSINDCVAFYYLTKFDVKYKMLLKQQAKVCLLSFTRGWLQCLAF